MDHVRIQVEHLCFSYEKKQPILRDITFSADGQETIGIIGANGVGKSTLLKLLVGLELDFEGNICVEGIPLEKKTLTKVREKTGYVFQDAESQLFMPTVYEDVAFAPQNYGLPEEEVKRRTEAALAEVHIGHLREKPVYKLSGGEKKLVSIATVLSMTPDIILMDEPTIALDPKNRRNLIGLLNGFPQLKIIASHDLDFIWDTCQRTILLADGKIIKDGGTEAILQDERLLEEYGLELPLSLYKPRREIFGKAYNEGWH